ncbi:hypothetical protein Zmor_003243 [Zophobas morio]|uniref:Tc1-like transposase DDE domain-containing protein n=1 Tax=Zophobas morio TaxID=2755281 RepID=A0AA38HL59_9CUCU|nr:hypothetical protein Zmor_003243 [Zophobas morio]
MNQEIFEKWFREQLIPSLREPTLIVIDNASDHSRLEEKIPRKSWTKTKMIAYLIKNGTDYPPKAMEDQIWEILANKQPQKRYHLDLYPQHHGHLVLSMPPYHCHFNAIEMSLSEVKRNYDKIIPRTSSSLNDVRATWQNVIDQIPVVHWNNYVKHTDKIVNCAWENQNNLRYFRTE